MSGGISPALRKHVAERAYHVCEYCLIHEDDTLWGCEIDHVISRKHQGSSDAGNLAFCCSTCNATKGTDVAAFVGTPPQLSRLFHPRQDKWSDCFALRRVIIESENGFGEATVQLLRLNNSLRLIEREALERAGRYPTIEALARMKE
jgi:hypothetical protein